MARPGRLPTKIDKSLQGQIRGSNLARLIKERGISRYRVAKDTGICYRTIQYWEAGRTPSMKMAVKLARYFGLMETAEKAELLQMAKDLNARIKRLGG
jgi:transcriptional regulator with XRE-family HTH domain